ncbi:MAG: hypothetical protein ACUVUR_04960 [bacterium]
MNISGLVISCLILTQMPIRGDIRSRANIRFAGGDSSRLTWFRTSVGLSFIPVTTEKIDSRVGFSVRTAGYPELAKAAELSNAGQMTPVCVLLDEAFVRLYDIVPGLTFTVGRQLIHWGTADAVNPTNNFTTPDYSDPLIWDERRPVWMVHFGYTPISALGFEFGAKPVFEPALAPPAEWYSRSVLPSEEELRSRLIQGLIRQGLDSLTARLVAASYTIIAREDIALPGRNIRDMTWGGRLKGHLGAFDVSLSFLRGYEFLPSVQPVTVINPQEKRFDFVLEERFFKKVVIGGDLAANIAGIGVWVEAAYNLFTDSLFNDELSVIGGLDYSFAGFYANLQFLHGQFPLSQIAAEPVQDFLLGGLEREFFSGRLLLRVGGVLDLKERSSGFVPLLRIAPVSGLELELGGLVFSGSEGSAFGALKEIKELSFGVRHRF